MDQRCPASDRAPTFAFAVIVAVLLFSALLSPDWGGNLVLGWCPGHSGVPGNERADLLAKKALLLPEVQTVGTLAHAKRNLKARLLRDKRAWWLQARPSSYAELGLDCDPDVLTGDRRTVSTMVSHRTRHGPFVSYLHRFGKTGTPRCRCGVPREVKHLLYCPDTAARRHVLARNTKSRDRMALRRVVLGPKALEFFPPVGKPYQLSVSPLTPQA